MICPTCFCAAKARRSARHVDGQLGYEQFVPWLANKRVAKVHEVLSCTSTDYEVWLTPIICIHMVAQDCADSFAWYIVHTVLHSGRKHLTSITRRLRLYQALFGTQHSYVAIFLIRPCTPALHLAYICKIYSIVKYCMYYMYITIHIEVGDTCFRDMSSQDDLPSRLDNQAARFHHRLREADGSTFVGVDVLWILGHGFISCLSLTTRLR